MHKAELIGMLLLAAIPAAAILGVFGPIQAEASAENDAVSLRVTFPKVMRHRTHQDLLVRVRNRTDQELAGVQISVDDRYLGAFNRVLFSQAATGAFAVTLEGIAPGETRLIAVELEADGYGLHRGEVRAMVDGRDLVADVATFMLP